MQNWCGVLFALICCGCSHSMGDAPRRIALSFDDAPRPADAFYSRAERASLLIEALAQEQAEAIFFATTANMDEEGAEILREYALAGHAIGNHSASHRRLGRITPDDFLIDLDAADTRLSSTPGFHRYFRFPFLDEGNTEAVRDVVRDGLQSRGYQNGYVTIDTYDWFLSDLLNQALRQNREVNNQALCQLYSSTLVESAEFYDALAVRVLGRSPAHVMLLHENDLAAHCLQSLVSALREHSWTIIPAMEAYRDPIAHALPNTLYLNQGRVAAIAAERGIPEAELRSSTENEATLRLQFEQRVLAPRQP